MYRNPVTDDYAKKFLGRLHSAARMDGQDLLFAGTTKSGGGKYEVYEGLEFYETDDGTGDFTGEFIGTIIINDDTVTLRGAGGNGGKVKLPGRQPVAEANAVASVFHAVASAGNSLEAAVAEFGKGKITIAEAKANPFTRHTARSRTNPFGWR
jgi:hypothetical protein